MSAPSSTLRPLVFAGPTASGKSAIALELARLLDGEIICADSRQVYARMRIVSAGPSDADCAAAPHVGYHVVDPLETYDAGRFVREADERMHAAQRRGRVPIFVGGTGMYLRSWRFGLDDVPDKDDAIRAQLNAELERDGLTPLFERLRGIDPVTAERIGPTDPHRTIRALEVHAVTGVPASETRRSFFSRPPRIEADWVLLEAPQPWLRDRVATRATKMFDAGLVDEATALRAHVGEGHRLLKTMGTEEALALADGQVTAKDALQAVAIRTRQYARRQRIWFRKEDWWTRLPAEELAAVSAEKAAQTVLSNLARDR